MSASIEQIMWPDKSEYLASKTVEPSKVCPHSVPKASRTDQIMFGGGKK